LGAMGVRRIGDLPVLLLTHPVGAVRSRPGVCGYSDADGVLPAADRPLEADRHPPPAGPHALRGIPDPARFSTENPLCPLRPEKIPGRPYAQLLRRRAVALLRSRHGG